MSKHGQYSIKIPIQNDKNIAKYVAYKPPDPLLDAAVRGQKSGIITHTSRAAIEPENTAVKYYTSLLPYFMMNLYFSQDSVFQVLYF